MTHSAAEEASRGLPSPADRGGFVVAAPHGELGIASAQALREQLLSLLRAASHLIIDLSAVEHADASGLAVLVSSGHRARLLGGSLRLAAPSPQVARVLSASGVTRHLDIFPTVRAAIIGQPSLPDAIASRALGEGATRCSRDLPTGRGRWWSWLRKRPGCSTMTTSALSTSCSA